MGEKLGLNEIKNYLENTHFPASKDQLVNQARESHVPENVFNAISSIPNREYTSAMDAAKAFVSNKLHHGDKMGNDSCDD